MRLAQLLALLALTVIVPAETAAIPDISDSTATETVRLVGYWAHTAPGAALVGRASGVVKIVSGPGIGGPFYSGIIRCVGAHACPGRRADLRDITIVRRTTTGRDSLVANFDADATFETGITCHFAGVNLYPDFSALATLFTCLTPTGAPAGEGEVHFHLRGR